MPPTTPIDSSAVAAVTAESGSAAAAIVGAAAAALLLLVLVGAARHKVRQKGALRWKRDAKRQRGPSPEVRQSSGGHAPSPRLRSPRSRGRGESAAVYAAPPAPAAEETPASGAGVREDDVVSADSIVATMDPEHGGAGATGSVRLGGPAACDAVAAAALPSPPKLPAPSMLQPGEAELPATNLDLITGAIARAHTQADTSPRSQAYYLRRVQAAIQAVPKLFTPRTQARARMQRVRDEMAARRAVAMQERAAEQTIVPRVDLTSARASRASTDDLLTSPVLSNPGTPVSHRVSV